MILFLLPLVFAFPGVEEKPAISAKQAKKLVEQARYGDDEQRAEARAALIQTREEDYGRIWEACEEGVFVPDRKHAKLAGTEETVNVDLGGSEGKQGEFIVQVPKRYKGKKPFPMLFRFHGSGDTGEDFAGSTHSKEFESYLTVVPTIPTEDRISWSATESKLLFDAAYRHMLTHYNVDTDRVYLSGYSAGGAAAFTYAQYWPQRFAGFVSRGRVRWKDSDEVEASMNILDYVPGFFLVGLDDKEDRVSGYRTAEAYYEQHDMPGEFRFAKGRGHEYMPEVTKDAVKFIAKRERTLYPKEFDAYFVLYTGESATYWVYSEQYWLRGLDYKKTGTPCQVAVDGNTITIEGSGLKKASLLLNDELVDMEQPVVVMLNGTKAYDAVVPRSVEFLLDWFTWERDPNRLFWNQIVVE
jgi:predicted esterase